MSEPVDEQQGPTAYQLIRRALLRPGRGQVSAALLLVL